MKWSRFHRKQKKNPRGQTWGERLNTPWNGVFALTIQLSVDLCKGTLIGDLCEEMKNYVAVYYPEFALGVALAIMSGACQRAYKMPGGFGVTYGLLIGPSGCGKNDYLEVARSYLRRIDPRLAASEQSSGKVTKRTLSEFPSRVWVADEIGDAILQGANPKTRDPQARAHLKTWLEMWSPPSLMLGANAMTKTLEIENVDHPRWSMLGAMTLGDFDSIRAMPEFVTKGLFSRLLFWHVGKAQTTDFKPHSRSFPVNEGTLDRLKKIFARGMFGGGNGMDADAHDWLNAPQEELTFEGEALELFSRRWRGADVDIFRAKEPERETVAGIVGRGKSKGFTFSAIHAVARGSSIIETDDVKWGCDLSNALVIRDLACLHLASEEDSFRKLITDHLSSIGGRMQTIAQLKRAVWALKHVDQAKVMAVVLTLDRDGVVVCSDSRRGMFCVGLPQAGDGIERKEPAVRN